MQLVGRVVSTVSEFYKDLNPATLSGAIDVVVVQQSDGELACSPFHVRFGKLKLLRPSEKVVDIYINGEKTDLRMKVGEAGEAFFVFEADSFVPSEYSTSPIQSPESETSDVEPLDIGHVAVPLAAPVLTSHGSRVMAADAGAPPEALKLDLSAVSAPPDLQLAPLPAAAGAADRDDATTPVTAVEAPDTPFRGAGDLPALHEAPGDLAAHNRGMSSSWASIAPDDPPSGGEAGPLSASAPTRRSSGHLSLGTRHRLSVKSLLSGTVDDESGGEAAPNLFHSLLAYTPQIDDLITEAYGGKPVAKPAHGSASASLFEGDRAFTASPAPGDPVLPATEAAVEAPAEKSPAAPEADATLKYSFKTLRTWWQRGATASPAAIGPASAAPLAPRAVLGSSPTQPSPEARPATAPAEPMPLRGRRSRSHDGVPLLVATDAGERLPSPSPPPLARSMSPPAGAFGLTGDDERDRHRYAKTLRLTSEQLQGLRLRPGANKMAFCVSTKLQGTQTCVANLFLWPHNTQIVISDIDGTITKSDALGHLFTMVGRDWTHLGVASLYTNIQRNGYRVLYLTSRAIGQASSTRDYLQKIEQGPYQLPPGPVIMSPDRLLRAFHREVIRRRPEEFKIACLKDIRGLFGNRNPFYAGFGNRITDAIAYRSVDVPPSRIFTIDPSGELRWNLLGEYRSSYVKLNDLVDQIFPPTELALPTEFNDHNYWKAPLPDVDFSSYDDEDEYDDDDYDDDGGELGESASSSQLTHSSTASSVSSRRSRRGVPRVPSERPVDPTAAGSGGESGVRFSQLSL